EQQLVPAAGVPDIGPTGADWFDDTQTPQPKDQGRDHAPLETQLDREVTNIGIRQGGMLWVAIVAGLVGVVLVIVLITQSGDDRAADSDAGAAAAAGSDEESVDDENTSTEPQTGNPVPEPDSSESIEPPEASDGVPETGTEVETADTNGDGATDTT